MGGKCPGGVHAGAWERWPTLLLQCEYGVVKACLQVGTIGGGRNHKMYHLVGCFQVLGRCSQEDCGTIVSSFLSFSFSFSFILSPKGEQLCSNTHILG